MACYVPAACDTDAVKRPVEVDEELLVVAQAALGTHTADETVNAALRLAVDRKRMELGQAMDRLAELVEALPVADRTKAW